MTTSAPQSGNTTAFYVQAVTAFAVSLGMTVVGQIYLPVPAWTRAFLALGTVFLVSSSFTLAKCIRDAQETGTVVSRLDAARVERLLAEFDPYKMPQPENTGTRRADHPDPQQYQPYLTVTPAPSL